MDGFTVLPTQRREVAQLRDETPVNLARVRRVPPPTKAEIEDYKRRIAVPLFQDFIQTSGVSDPE